MLGVFFFLDIFIFLIKFIKERIYLPAIKTKLVYYFSLYRFSEDNNLEVNIVHIDFSRGSLMIPKIALLQSRLYLQ